MKRLHAGMLVVLLLVAVAIAPTTYNFSKKLFAGENLVNGSIDHSAHHQAIQNIGGK